MASNPDEYDLIEADFGDLIPSASVDEDNQYDVIEEDLSGLTLIDEAIQPETTLLEDAGDIAAAGAAGIANATLSMSESIWRTPDMLKRGYGALYSMVTGEDLPDQYNPISYISDGFRVGDFNVESFSDVADDIKEAQGLLPSMSQTFADVNKAGQDADIAFEGALGGEFQKLGEVVSDPKAWAGFVGQAVPSLFAAWKSGGSIPFMAWLEGMEGANSAAEYEERTGQKMDDRTFTTSAMATGMVNGALEKMGLESILKGSGSLVKRFFGGMAGESATEGAQSFSGNLISRLYDKEASLTEGILPGMMGGAGVGGPAGFVGGVADKLAPPKDVIDELRDKVVDDIDTESAEIQETLGLPSPTIVVTPEGVADTEAAMAAAEEMGLRGEGIAEQIGAPGEPVAEGMIEFEEQDITGLGPAERGARGLGEYQEWQQPLEYEEVTIEEPLELEPLEKAEYEKGIEYVEPTEEIDLDLDLPAEVAEPAEPVPAAPSAEKIQRISDLRQAASETTVESVKADLLRQADVVQKELAGEKPKLTAAERAEKRKRYDPETEDLQSLIRKSGGIDTELESDWAGRLKPSDRKEFGVRGMEQPGKEGAITLDELLVRANEEGFNFADKAELEEALDKVGMGEDVYSTYRSAEAIDYEALRDEEQRRRAMPGLSAEEIAKSELERKEGAFLERFEPEKPEAPSIEQIDEAAAEAATSPVNDLPEPTAAQKEAGNYKKAHVKVQGLDIAIENPKGSVRSGTDSDGETWSNTMAAHYGYLKKTEGADGDAVDVFIGENPEAENVFIIDQVNPKDGSFDEHKIMMGYNTGMAATVGYNANYDKGWKGKGAITKMSMPEFKEWVKGDTTKPIAYKEKKIPFKKPAEAPKVEERRAEGEARKERRISDKARELYDQLSREELIKEIVSHELTGIKGRKAFVVDVQDSPVVGSIDADSLKWVNDNLSPDHGDALLQAVADAVDSLTDKAYHISGDEFYVLGESQAEIESILSKADDILAQAIITATKPDGTVITLTGLNITYGVGETKDEADQKLKSEKISREERGERAARGEQPPGAVIETAERVEADRQAAELEATNILDAANVRGKDRLDVMASYRAGDISLDDLAAAYPAEEIIPEPVPAEEVAEPAEEAGPVVEQYGNTFKTGQPVTFNYLHNKESATELHGVPDKDAPYGRGYEPSGRFMTVVSEQKIPDFGNFDTGEITFKNPLVVYNDNLQWKKTLSDKYDGRTGAELSKALIADGIDGVVTVDTVRGEDYVSEVVDLVTFDPAKAKYSKKKMEEAIDLDKNFKKWAGTDAEVISPYEINDTDFSQEGPFVMRVYHGTTHDFDRFEASIRGMKEGQFGAVNYFTSSEYDADTNYAGEGPDLTNRIQQRAERIESEEEVSEEAAMDQAREELVGGEGMVLELFIRTEKPFVVGDEQSPWHEFFDEEAIESDAVERVAENNNIEVSEVENNRDDYEDEIYDARWEVKEEIGNPLIEAIEIVADRYDVNPADILGDLYDVTAEGEVRHSQLEQYLRDSEQLAYVEDPETGDIVQSQMIGEVIQELGYDSIILKNAEERFENMDMVDDTAHIHIFDENNVNIKSATENIGTFDPTDPRILFSMSSHIPGAAGKAKGISEADAIKAIEQVEKELGKPEVIDIVTAPTKASIMNPEALRELGNDQVKGYYTDSPQEKGGGAIVLILEDLDSVEDAVQTLRHEWIVHHGLNTFSKADKKKIIDRVMSSKGEMSLKKAWAYVKENYAEATNEAQAEELLAYMAENKATRLSKLWNDLVLMVEKFLRKVGIIQKDKVTKAEIVQFIEDLTVRVGAGAKQRTFDEVDMFAKRAEAKPDVTTEFDDTDRIMYSKRTPKEVVSEIDAKAKGAAEPIQKFFKRFFTKEGLLNKPAFEAKILKDSEKNVGESDLSVMVYDFEKDMAAAYGVSYNKISDEDLLDVNRYLAGDKGVKLPKGLHRKLDHMRAYLDRLSGGMQVAMTDMLKIEASKLSDKDTAAFDAFLTTNGAQGYLPQSMQKHWNIYQTIEENKGAYLTRSYQAFDDEKWINKVKMNGPLMARARAFIAEERPELSPDEVIGSVNAILEAAYDSGNFMSFMSSGSKLGSKDTSMLTRRKDVPKVIRELLGEYKDPKVNFVRSASKMQYFVANHNFLMSLRNEGLGVFLFEQPTGEFAVEVAGPTSETMNPLNGLYTSRDFNTGLQDASEAEQSSDFMRRVIQLNSMVKYGKAQPLDAIIQTPDGPVEMGDVSVGDVILGAGKQVEVTGVYPQGELDVYKFTFNDGSTTEASDEHLWEVIIAGKTRIMTTNDLLDLPTYRIAKRTVAIPVEKAIFDEQPVPLDPYMLGALLGDGGFSGSGLHFSNPEPEIIDRIKSLLPEGYVMHSPPSWADIDYYIKAPNLASAKNGGHAIKGPLERMGLWGKTSLFKFIPVMYMRNSEHVRMEMMRGLLDTDGHVDRMGQPIFSTSSKKLAHNARDLAESLGASVIMRDYITASGNTGYSLVIRTHNAKDWFWLSRKKDKATKRKKPLKRTIASISYVGKKACQCISVDDPRHLYMTDRFILTHNTILSVTTQARNFQSAMMFSVMNGHFDWSHAKKAYQVAKADMFTKDAEWRKYINNLVGLGVIHNNPYAGEMKDAIEDFMALDTYKKGFMQNPKKFLNFMQKAYQVGDDFWKIIGFENELQMQIEAGLSPAEAEKKAAYRIRNGYPTYSMVPKGIKFVRRAPLVGTFVSFPYEIVRTSYNQIGFLKEDIKAGNNKLASRRALGMAIAASAAYAASVASMMLMGIDDEDDEAVRKLLPPWSRNSQLIYTGYDENGMPTYYDVSYVDPYTYLKKPISAIISGNNIGLNEKIADSMKEILEPFIGVDIGAGALLQLYSNEKDTGGKIWNEQAPDVDKAKAILDHIRKAIQPGTLSNVERIILAMQDERSRGGKQYTLSDETWALLGHRFSTLNIPQAMVYKSYEFVDAKKEASMLLNYVAGSASKVSSDDIKAATEKMLTARKKVYGDMIKIVKAGKQLNVDEDDLAGIMEASGVGRDDVDHILDGEVPPWDMPFTYGEKGLDRAIITAHDEERKAEIEAEYEKRLDDIDSVLDVWEKEEIEAKVKM